MRHGVVGRRRARVSLDGATVVTGDPGDLLLDSWSEAKLAPLLQKTELRADFDYVAEILSHAGQHKGAKVANFKGSYLGRFPLVLADFWTSDHLLERS